jgi:serine/threonine protein kinase
VKFHEVFKDDNFIMFVMDLLEGEDMFDAINSKLPLSEGETKFMASQLFLVIEHLHSNRIIYRDLKPENVMLTMDGYLTLVDMGTAKKLTI